MSVVTEIAHERLCQTCGYNLRGLAEARCPECGEPFNPTAAVGAHIPWLQRSIIGTWNAYWQTVMLAMFHPTKLGREVWEAQRLDPSAASRFRWVIIVQAVVCAN